MRRAVGAPAVAPFGRMLLMQTWSRLLWFWRIPAWTVSSLAMPVFFFTFFGLRFAHLTDAGGFSVGSYFLASFGAYAVGQVMVFSFGIGVSTERMLKQDLLMRATPLPPIVHLLARSLSALLFALVALIGLIVYGIVVGGIREDLSVWATVVVRLLAGSLPFIALGFAIGYLAGNAAPAVANLIYVPLSFASGLFIPVSQLPSFARSGTVSPHYQQVAPYLPTTLRPARLECDRRVIGARSHEPHLAHGVHGAVPGSRSQGLPAGGAAEVRMMPLLRTRVCRHPKFFPQRGAIFRCLPPHNRW